MDRRDKINYVCCECGKHLWTLRQNYIGEGQKCPICKRKSSLKGREDPYNSKKRKLTMLAKYGCINNIDKINETKRLKNNGKIVSEETKLKISQTLKNKTQVEKDLIKEKKLKSQYSHFNGNYFSEDSKKNIGSWTKTKEGKEKISSIMKQNSFKHRNSEEHIEYEKKIIKNRGYELLSTEIDNNNETFFKIKCNECGNIFEWHMIGDVYRPYCKYCFKAPYSKIEKEIVNFLSQKIEIIENDRTILDGKELDILIPSKNIAIEFDGLYWHNNINNSEKFEKALKSNIRLIRITEPEWKTKQELVKSFLLSSIGIFSKKIYARKCKVKIISNNEYKKFVEENHLQGYTPASVKLGLFYENQLVEIMSFARPRYSKHYEWEMMRECSLNSYNIIGGKSKLLKYFERNFKPKSLVSYCEKDKFSGISYKKCGFTLDHESPSNYLYFKDSFEPMSRLRFQKNKLKKLFNDYDDNLTEWENMERHGFMRLFDYGQFVFIKNY